MRIVAGEWRGRVISAPAGDAVRPTTDRVREAWMSIVHPWLKDARVLDLFAGSGALGLEALSRGAAAATFVDDSPRSLTVLRTNLAALGAEPRATVVRANALTFAAGLEADRYDVAFADPPYERGLAEALVLRWQAVPFARILGVEHSSRETLPSGGDRRRYGGSTITFFGAHP